MRQSDFFGTTQKEAPRDEESKNSILLLRGGYVDKTMAGVYSYLPLGLRVLRKVMNIVRQEMDKLPHTQELLMPALQPRELWEESGRWEEIGEVMYRVEEGALGLGPTHEEVVTDLFRRYVHSYKDLPLAVYQVQTKFRKEARAKSGLLRGREFVMKDMYSFAINEEGLDEFYDQAVQAYFAVFTRCGLDAILTEAAGGVFTKYSHEFQVINEAGEDDIYLNEKGDLARNKEIVPDEGDAELLAFGGGELRKKTATEVGNIFKLKKKFSTPMGASVSTEEGGREDVWMGCYGIGISRLVGTIVEVYGDLQKGKISWPQEVAPFSAHLIDLTPDLQGVSLYEDLMKKGVEILYDDRTEKSAGEKFADADLVGAPVRLVISKRSLEAGGVEYNKGGENQIVALDKVASLL